MGTLPVQALRAVAVEAQDLKSIRKATDAKPSVERCLVYLAPMSGTVVVHVVDGQEAKPSISGAAQFDDPLPRFFALESRHTSIFAL